MSVPGWTALVTVLLVLEYAAFSGVVAIARRRTGIRAPAMSGAPLLDHAVRVHLNTLEKLAMVLPLLWISALTVSDRLAAALAFGWLLTRIGYAIGYMIRPRLRTYGAIAGDVFEGSLALMALYGAIVTLLGS